MSVLITFQARGVVHAVVREQVFGTTMWFIWCHKRQVRGLAIEIHGSAFYEEEEIYTVPMYKDDILVFYEMYRNGAYKEKKLGMFAHVWEQSGITFRNYIKRLPVNNKLKAKRDDNNDGVQKDG